MTGTFQSVRAITFLWNDATVSNGTGTSCWSFRVSAVEEVLPDTPLIQPTVVIVINLFWTDKSGCVESSQSPSNHVSSMSDDITAIKQSAPPPPPAETWAPGLVTAHTGMRGLLAIWIVIFHCLLYSVGWNLQGSALMPLFFLLSGYSLAIGYGRANDSSPRKDNAPKWPIPGSRFDFKSFYQNRFARIIPVYYVGLLMALPLCIFGHGWISPAEIGRVLVSNLLAVQMWVPAPAIFVKSFDGPGWTISTLAFFYLLFPWLLRRYQGRTDAGLNRSITICTVAQAVVFFGLYFGVSIAVNPYPAAFWVAHAWPISRLPVFEMGLVAGLLVLRQGSLTRDPTVRVMGVPNGQGRRWAIWVDWGAGIFAFLILTFSIVDVVAGIDLGGWWWMQGVFPFTLLQIIVGLSLVERDGSSVTTRFLNWPPMLFLGRISMSLYLVHQPVIQYLAWIARPHQTWNRALPTPMPAWGTAIAIPVSLVLAVLLERYVETPARRYFKSRRHPTLSQQRPGSLDPQRT